MVVEWGFSRMSQTIQLGKPESPPQRKKLALTQFATVAAPASALGGLVAVLKPEVPAAAIAAAIVGIGVGFLVQRLDR
jgi:hypothetical protein